jgi:hypothetical protein
MFSKACAAYPEKVFNKILDNPNKRPLTPPIESIKLSNKVKTFSSPFVKSIKKSSFNKSEYIASAAAFTLSLAPSQPSA